MIMTNSPRESSSPGNEQHRASKDDTASLTQTGTPEQFTGHEPYSPQDEERALSDLERDETVDPYVDEPITPIMSFRSGVSTSAPAERLATRTLTRIRSGRGDSILNDYGDASVLPAFGDGKPYPPMVSLPKAAYEVGFAGPTDPLHPHNWPMKRKFKVGAILGYVTLMSAFGSAIVSSAIDAIGEHFHFSQEVGILLITLYVLGFATGPTIWAPASELSGRRLPMVISTIGATIFHFACGSAKDSQTLFLCRFFAGFCAAAPLAIVGAVFSDMFRSDLRGYALIVFSGMVYVGPLLAPVLSGFIMANKNLGWRWTFYFTGIFQAVASVVCLLFVDETFAPAVLVGKAAELRERTGNWAIHAAHENKEFSIDEIVKNNFARPIKMLFLEPLLLAMTIYTSLIYGILYMFLEAYPVVFQMGYHMSMAIHSLPYLALLIGALLGCGISGACEPYVQRIYRANNGIPVPEARLLSMCIGSILFPIGLFWFSWTGNYPTHVHWMAPTASGLVTAAGLVSIFVSAIQYIIESYLTFAASAMAANTLMRSAVGGCFPLFSVQLFVNLGVEWGGTLVALLATILVPVAFFFFFYGQRLRYMSKYSPYKAMEENKKQSEEKDINKATTA